MIEKAKPAGATGGHRETISVTDRKAHEKNTLRGFLSLKISDGLIIRNVCLHEKNGKRWVSMPARPYKRDDGDDGWQPLVEFEDDLARTQFQAAALASVDLYFAGVQSA